MRSSKKLVGLVIATAYLIIMTITVFTASYIVARAEDPVPEETTKAWYQVDEDGTLTVFLNDALQQDYDWKCGISDEGILRLSSYTKSTGGSCIACFKPTGTKSGDVTLTFKYVSNYEEKPVDKHIVKVSISPDQKITVAN